MQFLHRSIFPIAFAACLLITGANVAAFAQTRSATGRFPERPVQMVVAAAAGASSDLMARSICDQLAETWGKPVLVLNASGAGGGMRRVAEAAPDGYTLLTSGTALAIAANRHESGFDAATAFAGITAAASSPQMIVVRPDLGPKNFAEFLAYAKKRNGETTMGIASAGGIGQITNEVMAQQTGTKFSYIPFKGGAPATTALLGGHIETMVITMAAVTEHVRAGRIVPIAISTRARAKALPDVPTLAELGLKDFDIGSWLGFMAPAKTPRPVIDKIYADVMEALKAPQVNHFLDSEGFTIMGIPPAETDRLIASDIATLRNSGR